MSHQILEINPNTFPKESAGRRMTNKIPVVEPEETISGIEKILTEQVNEFETINYIYVVDKDGRLANVVSIKEIFRSPKEKKLVDFPQKEVIKIRARADQEKAALLALRHNIKAVPVVDKEDKLLGIVPSDEILNILHNENIEDFLRFAGIHKFDKTPYETLKAPPKIQIRLRLPWLIIGLFGGLIAAGIVSFFEEALRTELVLAMFIPLIVYMNGALGTQTQTIFVRSLVLDHRLLLKKYFWREMRIGLVIAFVCSLFLTLLSLFYGKLFISLVLGMALFIGLLSAVFTAFFITLLLLKLKKDPAFGSGPLATIIQDILSLIIYFGVATFFLRLFN